MILENLTTVFMSVAVCLWIHWLWLRRDLYKFGMNFNTIWGLPIIGIAYKAGASAKDFLRTAGIAFNKSGNTVFTWIGTYPFLFTIEPDVIENILTSPDLLNKAQTLYKPVAECILDGLVTLPANVWQHHRKVLNQVFHYKVLRNLLGLFDKLKQNLIEDFKMLADGQEHFIYDVIQKKSIALSFESTMGTRIDSDKLDLAKKINHLEEGVTKHIELSLVKLGWITRFNRKYRRCQKDVLDFVKSVLDAKLTQHLKNSVEAQKEYEQQGDSVISIEKNPSIFIDQAIDFYKKGQLSYDDIIVESNNIVLGSYDTTANALFSTIVLLAMHSDVQERVFEEISSIFPDENFQLENEHMEQLPYFDMVFNEVLRLVPPLPTIGRMAAKKTQISPDITFPKNLEILISIFHLHRRKDIWGPNADKFDPDNFLPENTSRRHAYAFMPFSKGIRNCIGWRYALFSTKVALTGLIRNFRFSTDFKFDNLDFVYDISLRYNVEPKITIEKR